MSNEVVLYDKKDSGVALISLNRPDRLNAITGELTARLKEKIDDACKKLCIGIWSVQHQNQCYRSWTL